MNIYLLYYGNIIKHVFLKEKDAYETVNMYNSSGGNGCYRIKEYEITDIEELLKEPKFEKRYKKAIMNKLVGD
jgi:hypothetical protein